MDVPHGFDPTLILVLNLAGTFIFGLSGGLAAVRAKLDLFGIVVLAGVVSLAGGITRDLLIGVPPATFRDWRYLAVVAGGGWCASTPGRRSSGSIGACRPSTPSGCPCSALPARPRPWPPALGPSPPRCW